MSYGCLRQSGWISSDSGALFWHNLVCHIFFRSSSGFADLRTDNTPKGHATYFHERTGRDTTQPSACHEIALWIGARAWGVADGNAVGMVRCHRIISPLHAVLLHRDSFAVCQ